MFFEVWDLNGRRGKIGLATRRRCRPLDLQGIVLAEPFHLSYPYVFESGGDFYMMPETDQLGGVRLLPGVVFSPPLAVPLRSIQNGPRLARNSSIFEWGRRLSAFRRDQSGDPPLDPAVCSHAATITGPWREHAGQPDYRTGRPRGAAGRTRRSLERQSAALRPGLRSGFRRCGPGIRNRPAHGGRVCGNGGLARPDPFKRNRHMEQWRNAVTSIRINSPTGAALASRGRLEGRYQHRRRQQHGFQTAAAFRAGPGGGRRRRFTVRQMPSVFDEFHGILAFSDAVVSNCCSSFIMPGLKALQKCR